MIRNLATLVLIVVCCRGPAFGQAVAAVGTVPVIYSTDLYHPHEDPDDHFDLVTLFALPEFDVRGIVIDLGPRGKGRPGTLAVRQMLHVTGRRIRDAVGAEVNLPSPEDPGTGLQEREQAGINLILDELRASRERVTIFCTGSLRDVAYAYNREPELFRTKVARLYINAGHSGGGREHNVNLDRHAYVRMMRSGLPVHWVPCFGADGYFSLWKFRQGDVLETAPSPLQNFFIYALTRALPKERDPIAALAEAPSKDATARIWPRQRNMWCTAAFLHAAGRTNDTCSFREVGVKLDDHGTTTIDPESDLKLLTFHRADEATYGESMRATLRELFAKLPVRP